MKLYLPVIVVLTAAVSALPFNGADIAQLERRQVPVTQPAMAQGGVIVPYTNPAAKKAKRQVPVNVPSKATNGNIVPYSSTGHFVTTYHSHSDCNSPSVFHGPGTIANDDEAMRLLTWSGQNELSLTDDLDDENIPPYAILSHTWGSDHDEVTYADIQKHQGQNKAGYAKLRFCGEQARKDGIKHFWVDTCCINKDNQNELSEAIISMFRWYANSEKCYVYLSDVQVKGNLSEIPWVPDFRKSRWFKRGWTLQELLAPANITTLPLDALGDTPLTQFPIDEKIRWTKDRKTKKIEDGAYCLLGIFNVSMSLRYGEGDNAIRRLRKKINKEFGADVAARLGAINEVRSLGLGWRPVPLNDADDFVGRAADSGQVAQVSRLGEPRPAKRVRTSYDVNVSGLSNSHSYCNTTVSHTGIMGGYIQQSVQDSRHNSMIISEDKYNVLFESLLFDRIDFRVNNVKKALLSTCQWLFSHPHFQTWYENDCLAQHSGFLWIKGKPGCGKSTLMKAVLEWALKQKSKDCPRKTIVPYFFNARASASLEKSSLGLYRTVVHHLLSSYPNLKPLFAQTFALKDPGESGENWTVEELQGFLSLAIESNESFGLCLLIDALDEAEYEDDPLAALANSTSVFRVVTILTSA
ncbi:hypothetical protein DV738_g212, partial [Chaetothyriales sp. CBS 135597]